MDAPPAWSYGAFAAILAPFAIRAYADNLLRRHRARTEEFLRRARLTPGREPVTLDEAP